MVMERVRFAKKIDELIENKKKVEINTPKGEVKGVIVERGDDYIDVLVNSYKTPTSKATISHYIFLPMWAVTGVERDEEGENNARG